MFPKQRSSPIEARLMTLGFQLPPPFFELLLPLDLLIGIQSTVHSVDLQSATDGFLCMSWWSQLLDLASAALNLALARKLKDVSFVKKQTSVSFLAGQPLGYSILIGWSIRTCKERMKESENMKNSQILCTSSCLFSRKNELLISTDTTFWWIPSFYPHRYVGFRWPISVGGRVVVLLSALAQKLRKSCLAHSAQSESWKAFHSQILGLR